MKKVQLAIVFFCVLTHNMFSQKGTTANFMPYIPQQTDYNPAFSTPYKSYIGLPALSGIEVQVNNSAFSLGNTITTRNDTAFIDAYSLLSRMSGQDIVGADFRMDLIRFGFQFKDKNYLHFGIDLNGEANAILQKNTFGFLLKGPGAYLDKTNDVLNGNSFNLNLYSSIYAGYNRELNDQWNVGVRARLLLGGSNIHTEKSDIYLRIDNGDDPDIVPYTYFIKPDIKMRASIAGMSDSGLIDNIKNASFDFASALKNLGVGVDIGVTYKLSDAVTFNASVSDIGFINWKANTKVLSSGGQSREFTFTGLGNLNDLIQNGDFKLAETLNTLKDSLVSYLDIQDTVGDAYRTKLNTKYSLGASIKFSEKNQFGVMWRYQTGAYTQNILSLAYTRYIGENVALTLNNAIINSNFFNFGVGISGNIGPLQLYLIVDKLNSFRVINMRAANIQLGVNIVFNRIKTRDL